MENGCIYPNCENGNLVYHSDLIILPDNTREQIPYFICVDHMKANAGHSL